MRTSVYTFLLITYLLLTQYAVLAGTDDSGLQVFTVDFSKQLGETNLAASEDTKISDYCYNLYNSGNGLTNFGVYTSSAIPFYGIRYKRFYRGGTVNGHPYVCEQNNGSGTYEINFFNGDSSSTWETMIASSGSNNVFGFRQLGYYYFVNADNFIRFTASTSTVSTLTGKPWQTYGGLGFNIWKNRLWVIGYNAYLYPTALYYSSASDMTDFTASATAGGVISLPNGTATITGIYSTLYGLYITTTSDGIYLLSGGDKPSSWILEKISTQSVSNWNGFVYENKFYFLNETNGSFKYSIFVVNGVNIEKICELPYNRFSFSTLNKSIFSGNFIIIPNPYSVSGYVYDIKNQSGFETSDINGVISENYIIKSETLYNYRIRYSPIFNDFSNMQTSIYPWAYKTSWLTLDGNASNRKEIDRIEFDYQGGTTNVYLYYAYGNGSSAYAATTLTAPINTRLSTYVWNAPIGRQQSNRFYLYFLSSGAQTMTTNYILKQARIYYRNIGNYKTNSLR
jgi:hypothetical protein